MNTRALVHELDREAKARFTDPTDHALKVLGAGNRVRAKHRDLDADTLRRLIASCDRDIYAETAAALGYGHEPRERSVRCWCGRQTWDHHATCDVHAVTCERCEVLP